MACSVTTVMEIGSLQGKHLTSEVARYLFKTRKIICRLFTFYCDAKTQQKEKNKHYILLLEYSLGILKYLLYAKH